MMPKPLGRVYRADKDLPFVPDGKYAIIHGNVEKVKRDAGSEDGLLYARKTVPVDNQQNVLLKEAKHKLLQEARVLSSARHRHVVQLVDAYFFECEQQTLFSIVMERADANLDLYLQRRTTIKRISHLSGWFGCLISALSAIHGLGIRHRDIKPSNILVKDKRILLADFGISKMGLGKTMPTTVPELARSRSPDYCAPEVEHGSTRGRSADIFSLGAVFLEMLIAHSYFSERQNLDTALRTHGHRSYALSIKEVYQFMDRIEHNSRSEAWVRKLLSYCRNMLHIERDQRPQAEELRSAWLDLQPSDLPLSSCTCSEVGEISAESRVVQLCRTGCAKEVEQYLSSGQDPNIPGAIHQASAHGSYVIVQQFLTCGVDVDLSDFSGQTALHCAAGFGHGDVVKLLLNNGANPQSKDDEGQAPLHCAAAQGHLYIVELLLSKDADIFAADIEGQTALQCAARRGHHDIVVALLNKGADAKAVDVKGRTALHFAAACGAKRVVEMLLDVVDRTIVDSRDINGKTALDFAVKGARAVRAARSVKENYQAVKSLLIDGGLTT